jgi:hypothetical protein
MIRRLRHSTSSLRAAACGLAATVVAVLPAAAARAEPAGDAARADALFKEARRLRDGGEIGAACVRFARSRQLAPGVGVSLNLADCYERMGRTASAWYEFGSAEKLAREKGDGRADVAQAHAQSLQGRLDRLTIAVPASTEATEIQLDGQTVPRAAYNIALAVDPGDHVVRVLSKSGAARSLDVHIEAGAPPVTVRSDDARPVAAGEAPGEKAPAAPPSPVDALFEEGKRLRDARRYSEACSKFAQSQALAPGVGITLHLADCYERIGRTASAWTEFVIAERAAHERTDKREATAHARALALEPRVPRLTIVVPASTPQETALVQLDGRTVAPSMWNLAVVADPGDHLVTFQAPGVERLTYPAHLDERTPSLSVRVGEPAGNGEPAAPASTSAAPETPAAPAAQAATAEAPAAPRGDRGAATRRWVEIGLLGGAVVTAGVGAGLLVVKNNSMSPGGANGNPYVDPVVTAASKISFAVAGAAAASAIVLYLVAPKAKDTGLYVSPAPMVGGGGALLNGSF